MRIAQPRPQRRRAPRRRPIALLAAALFVVLPAGVAHADWQTDRARAVAAKVWENPCRGQVTVYSAPPLQPTWRAWAYPSQCRIGLSTASPWTWAELCAALIHEYGHLAGYSDPANTADPTHSHDPDDIMWPYLHYDARCDDYGSALLGPAARPEAAPAATGAVGRGVSAKRRAAKRVRARGKSKRPPRARLAARV
jgi:hypothetical protein